MTEQSSPALLPRASRPDGTIDPEAWIGQPYFFSERTRGKTLYWPAGRDWFANDPLPPIAHSHPGAAEVYFVVEGNLEVTVGSTSFVMEAMDFCLIPTGAFHDPEGTNGTNCCMWCVVAPNWRGRRLQTERFGPSELDPVPVVARVEGAGALPSNDLLECACVELAPGTSEECLEWRPGSERLIYVLAGEAEIKVDRLSGAVEPHGFVHVPSGARHAVRNAGADVLRFVSVYALDPPGVGLLDPLPTFE